MSGFIENKWITFSYHIGPTPCFSRIRRQAIYTLTMHVFHIFRRWNISADDIRATEPEMVVIYSRVLVDQPTRKHTSNLEKLKGKLTALKTKSEGCVDDVQMTAAWQIKSNDHIRGITLHAAAFSRNGNNVGCRMPTGVPQAFDGHRLPSEASLRTTLVCAAAAACHSVHQFVLSIPRGSQIEKPRLEKTLDRKSISHLFTPASVTLHFHWLQRLRDVN